MATIFGKDRGAEILRGVPPVVGFRPPLVPRLPKWGQVEHLSSEARRRQVARRARLAPHLSHQRP